MRSVPQPGPKRLRFSLAQLSAKRLPFRKPRSPIDSARLRRLGRRKRGKGGAVASDRYGFTVFNPLGHIGKLVSQVADSRSFHRDTIMSHECLEVNADCCAVMRASPRSSVPCRRPAEGSAKTLGFAGRGEVEVVPARNALGVSPFEAALGTHKVGKERMPQDTCASANIERDPAMCLKVCGARFRFSFSRCKFAGRFYGRSGTPEWLPCQRQPPS
jgi:hypothetical protein